MNYLDLYSSYPDRTIAGVWESQVKEANDTPGLADALTRCGEARSASTRIQRN